MPIPGGGRYRVMTTKTGKKVRLHFTPGGRVNEAKNLATRATHTPAEFARDRLRSRLATLRRQGQFTRKARAR